MDVAQLEVIVNKLLTEFLPPVLKRLAAAEAKVSELERRLDQEGASTIQPRLRRPRTFEDYQEVHKRLALGAAEKDISKMLGIPYTTVRSYAKMKPEDVAALRQKAGLDTIKEEVPESHTIDTPASPEEYAAAGWFEWTNFDRQKAREVEGYKPPGLPAGITVMYLNGTIERAVLASAIDWAHDGVVRWKPV